MTAQSPTMTARAGSLLAHRRLNSYLVASDKATGATLRFPSSTHRTVSTSSTPITTATPTSDLSRSSSGNRSSLDPNRDDPFDFGSSLAARRRGSQDTTVTSPGSDGIDQEVDRSNESLGEKVRREFPFPAPDLPDPGGGTDGSAHWDMIRSLGVGVVGGGGSRVKHQRTVSVSVIPTSPALAPTSPTIEADASPRFTGSPVSAKGRRPDLHRASTSVFSLPSIKETASHVSESPSAYEGGLMAISSFGPRVREKVGQVLVAMCETVPLPAGADDEDADDVVSIVEYGATHSRSAELVKSLVSHLEHRTAAGAPSTMTYSITHADKPDTDFRSLQSLDQRMVLDPEWQRRKGLTDRVFGNYVGKAFGRLVVPRGGVSVGLSVMEMQRAMSRRGRGVSAEEHGKGEMKAFLKARAQEFRKGGALVLAFVVSREPTSHPHSTTNNPRARFSTDGTGLITDASSLPPLPRKRSGSLPSRSTSPPLASLEPTKPCPWQSLQRVVAFSIRSLVTQELISPHVAAALEQLPLHSRTARQTRDVLESVKDAWRLEWSCGIGANEQEHEQEEGGVKVEVEEPLRLKHPAQTAFQAGAIGAGVWAEHAVSFIRTCFEDHCRAVLLGQRQQNGVGVVDKGRVEFVLEMLWQDLEARVLGGGLGEVELEIAVVGLRRI